MIRYYLLAAVLALHASDASRFVYVWFDLAPDCPVVGRNDVPTACHSNLQDPPAICHSKANTHPDAPAAPDHAPSDQERNDPENCPTCRMLAVVQTFTASSAAETLTLDVAIDRPHILTDQPRIADTALSSRPRAPPIYG